ncbi:hypothetical protein [Bradyrhizobium septentrionale]|uniref:Uncharacterized protein n=1 Tax=Bradyrhizobium septentrionale TaxID=1404411 RepID=A0A973W1L7_9BRAD|nr:hypothetical protein [Bradyrhizobium septentrionale]UGY14287.1 hypothetical protein HAP48_0037900 [Bradyrhizobium septentrionale]UGY23011.1 hypothetical protein HU675_0034360 [Bradyrhizobium septentrionale]
MDWTYLLAISLVLILVAYGLHGALYRTGTQRDRELNRLMDERVDRLKLKREKTRVDNSTHNFELVELARVRIKNGPSKKPEPVPMLSGERPPMTLKS